MPAQRSLLILACLTPLLAGRPPAATPSTALSAQDPTQDPTKDPKQDPKQDPKATAETAKKPDPAVVPPVSDEKLFAPYARNDGLLGRLQVAPAVRAMSEDDFANRVIPKLTGERNRLIVEVKNLVEALGDVRYAVRVQSEKALIDRGPLILPILDTMLDQDDLEIQIRLERVRTALGKAGTEDIEREARIARGLAEALAYRLGDLELDALLSALGSLDARVRLAALRSAGIQLRDPARAKRSGAKLIERARAFVDNSDLELRNAATAAIGLMPLPASREFLLAILRNPARATSHRILALRLLAARHQFGSELTEEDVVALSKGLEGDSGPLIEKIGAFLAKPKTADLETPKLDLELEDGGKLEQTRLLRLGGDELQFDGPAVTGGLPLNVPRTTIDLISNAQLGASKPAGRQILLASGTRLRFEKLGFADGVVTVRALDRDLRIEKSALRGILPDASNGRALGGSRKSDQIRLRKGEKRTVEGKVLALDDDGVTVETGEGEKKIPWAEIEVQLFQLDGSGTAVGEVGDINQFVQVDLAGGERLVGYLIDLDGSSIRIAERIVGCVEVPLSRVAKLQLSNSGRALTGFTLVADYGNTSIVELDGEGRVVWKLEDLFDPLDAELTPTGTILVTEQGDDAVREYDRNLEPIWEFTNLERPIDADRLANGNTLITDPGNNRVVEVNKDKDVVWTFGLKEAKRKDFKPYDADRLLNGNTLICDHGGKRVIEVGPGGDILWELKGLEFLADADRLPNGNTLITRRSPAAVLEVNPQGVTVWKLEKLQLPGDADRLPDGTTMVAEDGGVRIYSRDGRVIKKLPAEWATEANGY